MTRQDFLENSNRPLLKILMSGHIDRATECVMSGIPSLLPDKFLLINKNPEHLKYRNSGVQFIQQDLILLIKLIHLVHDVLFEPPHQVLESSSGIEIFLLESLFLVLLLWDIWVVNTSQVLSILNLVYFVYQVIFTTTIGILILFKIGARSPKT